jgi:hypothetical protein
MITKNNLDESAACPVHEEPEQTPEKRLDKVRQIRRKIKSGKYDPEEHLNLAMDRLIEEILMQKSENQARV